MTRVVNKQNVSTWPKNIRQAIDAIAIMFATVYDLSRTRAASHPSPIIREIAQTDSAISDAHLKDRELGILLRNREGVPARQRPHYSPDDRLEIILVMRLRNWSLEDAAAHFAIHENTIRAWIKELETDPDSTLFTGVTPHNKFGDAVRQLAEKIRALCPQRDFGTRSIAMAILRAGIQLGRSSVQRYLRKPKPAPTPQTTPAPVDETPEPSTPRHILRPTAINKTWHLDLTTFEFRSVRFYTAAVLDGFSRKLLALRVYADAPNTNHLCCLMQECARKFGAPSFLVTDHGCQFRKRFINAMEKLGTHFPPRNKEIRVVKGRKDPKRFNGKVERFFRTLKLWQRVKLLACKISSIQRRLDIYRNWYNTQRPMKVLDGRTPEEMWTGAPAPEATPILARDPQPEISVTRKRYRNDPHLFVLDIRANRSA